MHSIHDLTGEVKTHNLFVESNPYWETVYVEGCYAIIYVDY